MPLVAAVAQGRIGYDPSKYYPSTGQFFTGGWAHGGVHPGAHWRMVDGRMERCWVAAHVPCGLMSPAPMRCNQ